MPIHYPYSVVDVFSERRYAGNQLAVFRCQPPDDEMQSIAIEMNYSETTFITSEQPHDGGYDVRIFTTTSELPFAGHPTLGTAYVIRREIIQKPVERVVLNLKVGQIPVTFGSDGVLWMQQKPPVFGNTYAPAAVAEVLGLRPGDIDERFPVEEVSTGLPWLLAPLKTRDAVKRARLQVKGFKALLENAGGLNPDGVFVFCPEPYHPENQFNARALSLGPYGTVIEDPATGSANGNFAGYLAKHHYFGTERVEARVEQGYEIGRPALLLLNSRGIHKANSVRQLRSADKGTQIDVQVGGTVLMIARGEFVE
jgi:trans-2,3-dihydro-3-hydroxyanthranilate isomerase